MGVVQHPASCPHPEQGALQACPPPAAQPAATAPRAGLGQPPDPPRLRGPGPLRLPMCLPHTPSPSVPPDSLLLTTAGPGGEAAAVTWRSDPVIPPFLETVRTKTVWLWASQPKQGDGKRGEFRAGPKRQWVSQGRLSGGVCHYRAPRGGPASLSPHRPGGLAVTVLIHRRGNRGQAGQVPSPGSRDF